MSFLFRGKEVFKPLNTGFIDKRVSCIREYVANIYFYTKDGHTIMIDAGYNYDRLLEKMKWFNINGKVIDGYDERNDTEENARNVFPDKC